VPGFFLRLFLGGVRLGSHLSLLFITGGASIFLPMSDTILLEEGHRGQQAPLYLFGSLPARRKYLAPSLFMPLPLLLEVIGY